MAQDGVDFVVAAYREEGAWQAQPLPSRVAHDMDALLAALRSLPSESGAIGLVSVDEDFFVLVRVLGPRTKILLSDVTAATDWPIARAAVDALELPLPDDEDEQAPAGDLAIVADLGMGAMDMGALLDDVELYPDEMLGQIAARIGFGPQFDRAVDDDRS